MGVGGAAEIPDSLPGEPPTSEPRSLTATSQEHTVLFVGADMCSLLFMLPMSRPLSLSLPLIWSLPAQQAQLHASDPGKSTE